jgi:hypothetical protein
MEWKKAADAAKEWCGNVHPKILYAAHADGRLKAARYGTGANPRNLLFCEQWCTDWLLASAEKGERVAPSVSGELVEMRPREKQRA